MLVSEFQYELPEELIAQEPLADRAGSRMLHVHSSGELSDRRFREFPELLRVGDLVVFNDTRVFPARLYGRRSGGSVTEDHNPHPSTSSGQAFSQKTREMGHPNSFILLGCLLFRCAGVHHVAGSLRLPAFFSRVRAQHAKSG